MPSNDSNGTDWGRALRTTSLEGWSQRQGVAQLYGCTFVNRAAGTHFVPIRLTNAKARRHDGATMN